MCARRGRGEERKWQMCGSRGEETKLQSGFVFVDFNLDMYCISVSCGNHR